MADVRQLTDPAVEAAATRLHWLHGAPPAGVPCDPGPVEAARRAAAAAPGADADRGVADGEAEVITGQLVRVVADCMRFVRAPARTRRAAPPKPLLGLTMEQAARILAPRPRAGRAVRRAVVIGCPAGVLPVVPHVASAPGLPLPVPPVPPDVVAGPLPFGIGGGPLLPPVWTVPPSWVPTLPDLPVPSEAVPEPATLALLLAAVVLLAVVRRWAG